MKPAAAARTRPARAQRLTALQKLELQHPEGTPLERSFDTLFKQCCPGLPAGRKLKFDETRGWEFDRAWFAYKYPPCYGSLECIAVAVELDGKVHLNEDKWRRDIEKQNAAVAWGWKVYRCTSKMLEENPGAFFDLLRQALEGWPKEETP